MTEQQTHTIINNEIHIHGITDPEKVANEVLDRIAETVDLGGKIEVHGLMLPEQIAEVIRNAYPANPRPFKLPNIASPSAEAAEAAKHITDNAAAGLAAAFDENLNAVRADAAGAPCTGPSRAKEQLDAEQAIAAYTRNSTNERVTAQRWDGTKESTANIVKWLTRHGEEVWVQHDKLHARTLNTGTTNAIEVGDWIILERNQAYGAKDHAFRKYYTWGEPQEKPSEPVQKTGPIPVDQFIKNKLVAAPMQRIAMRAIIEQLGDRGAMNLLVDVAGEIDLEHC